MQQGGPVNIDPNNAQLIYDEYGRPFIIVRDQDKQNRVKGLEAHKVSFLTLKKIAPKKFLSAVFLFLRRTFLQLERLQIL